MVFDVGFKDFFTVRTGSRVVLMSVESRVSKVRLHKSQSLLDFGKLFLVFRSKNSQCFVRFGLKK